MCHHISKTILRFVRQNLVNVAKIKYLCKLDIKNFGFRNLKCDLNIW
jgi:hypothetical protein